MAKIGGYQIIDLKNNDLLSLSSLAGIYDAIEGNYRKPILLEGIVISNVEKASIYVIPELSGSSYVLRNVYGYDVTIADDDTISVASTQWATKAYVQQVIEGGTLENAKPIYCHPITLLRSGSSTLGNLRLTCLIFNNNSTPFTLASFKKWLDDLTDAISNARIMVSGGLQQNTESKYIISASYLLEYKEEGNRIYDFGGIKELGAFEEIYGSWDDIFLDAELIDDVNKIN